MTRRPAAEGDRGFLRRVYGAARAEELAPVPWPDATKEAFLDEQFRLQDASYRDNYPDARFQVIEGDGSPIGRLYLADLPGELRVMDIALLAEHRGAGIGTRLMREVIETARADGRAVTLHVERWNPACRLYERLGFEEVREVGAYVLLRLEPTAPPLS